MKISSFCRPSGCSSWFRWRVLQIYRHKMQHFLATVALIEKRLPQPPALKTLAKQAFVKAPCFGKLHRCFWYKKPPMPTGLSQTCLDFCSWGSFKMETKSGLSSVQVSILKMYFKNGFLRVKWRSFPLSVTPFSETFGCNGSRARKTFYPRSVCFNGWAQLTSLHGLNLYDTQILC